MDILTVTSLNTDDIRAIIKQELGEFFNSNPITKSDSLTEEPIDGKELCDFLKITIPTLNTLA